MSEQTHDEVKSTIEKNQRNAITALFTGFAGQGRSLVIPRPYIDFCGGDHLAALLLSQILYWSERTDDPDGWFTHSYKEWQEELALTQYQIKRAMNGDKRYKNGFAGLTSIGIVSELRRSKHHKGAATLHYRVIKPALQRAIIVFTGFPVMNLVDNDVLNLVDNDVVNLVDNVNIEYAESRRTKDIAPSGAEPIATKPKAKTPTRPAAEFNPLKDAIAEAFGWQWSGEKRMTKDEVGKVLAAARDLYDAEVRAELIPRLHTECKKRGYDNFGPNALCGVVSDVRKANGKGPAVDPDKMLNLPDYDDPTYWDVVQAELNRINGIAS